MPKKLKTHKKYKKSNNKTHKKGGMKGQYYLQQKARLDEQKRREIEFNKYAEKKLNELNINPIPITYRNITNTPLRNNIPTSASNNTFDSNYSFKTANTQFDTNTLDSINDSINEYPSSYFNTPELSPPMPSPSTINTPAFSEDELNKYNNLWDIILNYNLIFIIKVEEKLLPILPEAFKRFINFHYYFIIEQKTGNIHILNVTDPNGNSINDNNKIISLLRVGLGYINPWKYKANFVVNKFYETINQGFFGNPDGNVITIINKNSNNYQEIINQSPVHLYNNNELIIQTQEIEEGILFTYILDFFALLNDDIENYLDNENNVIFKPNLTMARCPAREVNNNCTNSCNDCISINY
jgi:hypothetical protein